MNKFVSALLLALTAMISQQTWAARCDYIDNTHAVRMTIPLSVGNISVGKDVSIGTIVHSFKVVGNNDLRPWQNCKHEGAPNVVIDQYLSLINTPSPVSNWGGPYAGAIYQTTVPGLGFAIINNDGMNPGQAISTVALKKWMTPISQYNDAGYSFYYGNSFTIYFIKTGDMNSGSVDGTRLPTVLLKTNSATPVAGVPDTIYSINFSGSLNVIAATCTTPDVNVNMGKWDVSNISIPGQSTTTAWVPFQVNLTGCPAMRGNFSDTNSPPTYDTKNGFTAGKLILNAIDILFTPSFGVVDAAQGIMNIQSGANAAKGVGIQVANDDGAHTLVNFNNKINKTLPQTTSGSNYSFGFAARYIKTGTTVTPGIANGKMIFNINYY